RTSLCDLSISVLTPTTLPLTYTLSLHDALPILFFGAACRERATQQFAGPNGIKESLAGERIDPGRRVTDKRPVLSDDISLGKRPLLGRRQYMAVKLCALRRYVMFLNKILQVSSQLCSRMRGHAPAHAYREMIAARERPDVAFKLRQEFDGDGISRLRHEVAMRHL